MIFYLNIITTRRELQLQLPSLIKYKNAYGLQFHPEKSYTNGLEIIKEIIKNGFKKR